MAALKPLLHEMVNQLDARNERLVVHFLRWLLLKTSAPVHHSEYRVTVRAGRAQIVQPMDSIDVEAIVI